MSARLTDLHVGARVRYEVGGLAGTGAVAALRPGSTFEVVVHADRGPAMTFRTVDLTILPAGAPGQGVGMSIEAGWDDDHPHRMRVHVASERGLLAVRVYGGRRVRREARVRGVDLFGATTAAGVGAALAAQGYVDDRGYFRVGWPQPVPVPPRGPGGGSPVRGVASCGHCPQDRMPQDAREW